MLNALLHKIFSHVGSPVRKAFSAPQFSVSSRPLPWGTSQARKSYASGGTFASPQKAWIDPWIFAYVFKSLIDPMLALFQLIPKLPNSGMQARGRSEYLSRGTSTK